MKEVELKNGKKITTPWLRVEEAAAYCGLSRSAFVDHAQDLPHGGDDRTRIYNVKILDAWLANELPIPFKPAPEERQPRRSHPNNNIDDEVVLVNPANGEVAHIKLKKDRLRHD